MDQTTTYYAKRDVYAEVEEEGGTINRLVAVEGQAISPAFLPYVGEEDRTTDQSVAQEAALERSTTARRSQIGEERQAYREEAAAVAGPDAEQATEVPAPTDGALELAEEEGVDLAAVEGTGKDGRVTVEDVRSHLEAAAGQAEPGEEEEGGAEASGE